MDWGLPEEVKSELRPEGLIKVPQECWGEGFPRMRTARAGAWRRSRGSLGGRVGEGSDGRGLLQGLRPMGSHALLRAGASPWGTAQPGLQGLPGQHRGEGGGRQGGRKRRGVAGDCQAGLGRTGPFLPLGAFGAVSEGR